jgi:hypothetical protein
LGHHLGEAGHVVGEAVELCPVAAQVGDQLPLARIEILGSAQRPAGDLADLQ